MLGREPQLIKTPPATRARLQLVWLTTQCFCAHAYARWLLCVNSEGAPGEACVGCCWSTVPLHSPEASLSILQRNWTSLSNGLWRFAVSSTPEMPSLGFKHVLVEAECGFSISSCLCLDRFPPLMSKKKKYIYLAANQIKSGFCPEASPFSSSDQSEDGIITVAAFPGS